MNSKNSKKILFASIAFSVVFLASAGLGTLSNTIAEASEISGSLSSSASGGSGSQTGGSLGGGSGSSLGSLGGTVAGGSGSSGGSGGGSGSSESITNGATVTSNSNNASEPTNSGTQTPIISSGGSTGPALTGRVAVNTVILADGGTTEVRPPVGEVLGTSTDEVKDATSPSLWSWWVWVLLALLVLGVLFLIYSYNTRDENTQRFNSRR